MTTIATDGRAMAGDGRLVVQDIIASDCSVKVQRIAGGILVGGCGSEVDQRRLVSWIEAGAKIDDVPSVASDFGALALHPDGRLFIHASKVVGVEIQAPFALGSGR